MVVAFMSDSSSVSTDPHANDDRLVPLGATTTGESIPSVNRTPCQLRWQVPYALRAPVAGYVER